ncbi:MAG: class I SAM-dependent methyltransferase [Ferruginibacter sp.]|nr:class I SAM-dependent methyltransferase [Chitinophagaceae bacterium]
MRSSKVWTGERLETDVFTETSIEHLHRYAITMELAAGKKVLDIACGEGYGSALLAKNALQVTGVDIEAGIISMAKDKYPQENLQFLTGSVENIPSADQQFEVVVSFETLEHIGDHEKMISEIKRVLLPGGLLVISTPDKKNYTDTQILKNPFHVKELYAEEFGALLQKYFKNVELLNQQIAFSSVITSEKAEGQDIYAGDYREIKKDPGGNRLYCIALASDEILPPVKNSLFNGQSIFAEAVAAKEKLVINTITYQTGKAILFPFKLLRKLFKK